MRLTGFKGIRVPLVCAVGASKSVENIPIEGWVEIKPPKGYRESDRLVAAPVEGDSLIGDRICHGDIAILRLNFDIANISNGDICAILTPYGCLLKHVYLTLDDRIRLVSSNPTYKAILLDLEHVEIQGVLEQVIVRFKTKR